MSVDPLAASLVEVLAKVDAARGCLNTAARLLDEARQAASAATHGSASPEALYAATALEDALPALVAPLAALQRVENDVARQLVVLLSPVMRVRPTVAAQPVDQPTYPLHFHTRHERSNYRVVRRSSARRSPMTETLGIGSRSKKDFLWRSVNFSPSRDTGETGFAQKRAKDRVSAVWVTRYQATDRQRRERLVVEVLAQLGKTGTVSGQCGVGEERIEGVEIAVEAESFDLVVDQRDAVGIQQFIGQQAQVSRRRTGGHGSPGCLAVETCHRVAAR
ncbi:hypothetical protein [Actinokineospora sp. HUAS TT18]|uniref:hypothetical protein n=1 Tax=Actinokineospora sp. HUAS TT18 TaxID=3447451 RepID=UPI003F52348B